MVPADATIQCDEVCLLVVHVYTHHLGSCQALSTTTEAATSTTKTHIVDVVGTCHQERLEVVLHDTTENTASIAVLRTCSQVGIDHDTLVHTCLDAEVEHGFFLTVIDTADTGQVTLLVVCAHALNNRGGQVLHGGLRITRHKLLTINLNFLHLLTVDGNLTVVIDLSTRQTLHQFLHNGALWCTVGRSIIYKGVGLHNHLCGITRHNGVLQHDSVGLQFQRTQCDILVVGNVDTLGIRFKTYTSHLQDVVACLWCCYAELSFHRGQSTRNEC